MQLTIVDMSVFANTDVKSIFLQYFEDFFPFWNLLASGNYEIIEVGVIGTHIQVASA